MYTIYKSRETHASVNGWAVQFDRKDMPEVVDPDLEYLGFKSRKSAQKFAEMVDGGMRPEEAFFRLSHHASGTPPDTSLYLGPRRRAWLIEQGGIQPTINQLVDGAMSHPPQAS